MSEWDDFMKKYGGGSNSQTESADGQSSGQGNGGVTASDWDAFMARYGQGAQAQAQPKQQVQPQQNAAAAQPAAPVTIASVRQPEQASVMHPGEAAQYMPKQIQNGIDFAEKYAVQPAHVRDNKAPVLKAADNVNSVKEELSALQQEVVAAETKILDLVRNNTIVGEDNKRVFTDQAAKDAYDAAYKECEAAMRKHAVAARRLTDAAAVFDFQYNKHVQAYNEAAQARAQAEYEKTDYYKYKTMYDAGQLEPDYINNLKASAEQEVEKWNNELDTLFSYAEDDRPADYSERLGQAYTNIEAALSSLEKANDLAIVGPEWRNYFAVESKRGAQDWDEKVAAGREIYEEATEKRTEDYQNSGVIMQGLAGFSDDPFDYYNAITDIKDDLDDRFPASNQYVKTLSEEDRDMYFYLLGNGEQEVALDFVDAAMRGIRKERLESVSEWAGTNVGTRLLAYIASGFMTLGASLDLARETGKYGYHISDVKHALDEGIAQGLTEKGLFNQGWLAGTIDEDIPVFGGKNLGTVAQLGASMRDSVIAALISAGAGSESAGALMLASDAGYMAYRNSLDNGAPEKDAFLYGIAAGVAEYVFEKVSIGELLKKPSASWWKEALKQGGVEASEETLTTLANTLSQRVILKDYSDYNIAWRKYMTEGYSEGEAKQKAISDAFYGVMDDAIGGFISGGVMQGGHVGINAIHNAYTDHQKAKIRAANGGILYFDREQRLNREALDAQMAEYNKLYGNGDADVLAKMGLAEDQIKKALKDYEEIKQDYEKCKEMSVDTETSDAANSTPDIGVDRRIFTEDTAAEDARSVVEAHRQLEQDGRLQDPNVAQELLQAAEAATSIVNNAKATGRLTAQEEYDNEIALRRVINQTRAILNENTNTPAQITTPETTIGGMDNGRAEGTADSTQRDARLGADEQGRGVAEGTGARAERGRTDALEIRRALAAGEFDRTSPKEAGVKGGSRNETMQILRDSVVDRIESLRTIRAEAAKDGLRVVFFGGTCEVYNKYAKGNKITPDGIYDADTNTVYLKADQTNRSAAQLYNHEMMHNMLRENPEMRGYLANLLAQAYTPEGLDRLIAQYCEAYRGCYGTFTESMTEDEYNELYDMYLDELLADAYALIRRGSINTVKAEQALESFRADSGKENAAATDRTNGSGENKTAGTEAGGEVRYSAEEENQREEHKERITPKDISNIHTITREKGQISINSLNSEEIKALSKWAYMYWNDPKIGVKSPFFRAWFGEWRAHQTGEYITVADIPEYVATNEARKANRGPVQNGDTGWTIQVSREGETNTISHAGADKLSEYGLSGIRALIQNAYLFNTELHEHHANNAENDQIAFDHKLYALGTDRNGDVGLYRITVEEYFQSKSEPANKRFHNLKYIEKVAELPADALAGKTSSGGSTNDNSTTNYSIADLYSLVKQFDSDFTPAKEVNPFFLNDDGTPRVFYHGAKNGGGFEVFKNWQYFTEQEQYAQRYAKRDDPSAMYAVYLTADKVFDTRNADAAKAFESIRQEYGLSELQDTGLPDWTDGYDITDYLSEHPELGYDAVLLDEGGDLVDGKPVSRGTSIVIKNPTQVKSATENIGTYDRGNENYRYSVEDDAAELDEVYRRSVEKDAAENEPTERGKSFLPQRDAALGPDYAAIGTAEIERRAKEATLPQLRNMEQRAEEELNRYRWAKRHGILTAEMEKRMETVEETVKIQSEELKHRNAEERRQREKRKEEEAKQQQPRIAKKELKATIAEIFSVPANSRKAMNDLIETAANKIIQQGYISSEDKTALRDALLRSGVVNIAPEGYYGEIRSYVQQGRIYVPESVREEFGDDWNDFRKRAWGNRIYLTNDTTDRPIDDWNQDLAQMFPGGFEEGATDMKEALEQIVRLAEEGSAENITIAEMMERNQDNYGWSVETQMEQLEEQFDAALKSFAEKANVEIKARQEKATEVLKERRKFREMIERESARRHESEQRNSVMKSIQQLNRMRNRTAPEVQAQIDEVLNGIDTVARSISDRGLENLIELAKAYEQAKTDNPNFIPNPYVEARLARLQQTQLDDMEIGDVIELGRTVSALVKSVQDANKLMSEEYKAEIDATAREFVKEMQATKGSKGGKLYQWAVENHLSPVRFLRHLGGWVEGGASAQIAQSLENGQTRQMRYLMEASQIFDRFMSDKANRKWLETASGKNAEWIKVSVPVNYNVNENDQTEIEWKDIEITPMMRVALMMHSKNYDNLRHIEGGGMTIPDKARYIKGDMKNAYAYGTRVKMTPETVRAIVKDCTPTERAFAKLLQQYYNQFSKDRINEVSVLLDGFERAGGENYYHIKVNQNFIDKLPDAIQKNISIESIGSIVNERVYAQNPIVLEDASVSLADHMEQISKYYGFATAIHDYDAIMKYTEHQKADLFKGAVKEVLGQQWGAGAQEYLDRLMENLQSSTGINDMTATFFGNLRGKLAGASLMFNPAVALSQTASYPGAMQTLGARALAEGLKLWERVDTDLIEKYSPLLWYRNQGNSTQELGDYMEGRTLEHKLPWLLGWIQKMDSATVRRLWAAAEYYVSNNTDLKPGSEAEIAAGTDEYYQKVAEMFNRAVYDTQPNYSTMQRPHILRSDSDFTKFLTMFKTVPLQYYNMMFEAAGRLSSAKQRGNAEEIKSAAGYFARTTVGLISANAIYVAMKALFKVLRFKDKDYRDEEGELTVGSFMGQLGLDFLDTSAGSLIGGAELLDVIERIAAAVGGEKQRYNGIDINAISFVADVVQDIMDLGSAIGSLDGKDLADAIRGIVKEGVMGTLGLPAQNAETYLLALVKWISPETAERYNNLFSDRSKSTLSEEHGRYLEAAISVYMDNRAELSDEVKQELQRLWEAGQKNAIPSAVPSSVTVGGESVALTSDQKAQFRKDWSRIVSENLEAMIGSEYYQSADETTQGKLIDRLYRYASEVAKENLGIDYTAENWAASAETDGLPEYLTYYTLRSMLDRDGSEMQNTAAVAAVMDYVIGGISEDDSAEIARLYMVGAEGLIPQTAPTSIEFKDENGTQRVAELDAEQRAKYAEAYRNAIGNQLGVLMSSPEYADADDKGRTALIGKVFDFAAGVAKAEVAEGYTPDKWILNGFEDMEDGIQLADYIVYHTGYTRLNGKNEDGESESGLKDRRTLDLIDGNDWTDDQKISVYLDNCSNAAAGKVKAMDAAGFSWKQIKTVLTADKQEIAVLQANVSDSAKLKVLEIYCNEKQMAKYQVGYQFGVSFKDYAEVMQNANTDGKGSITQDEATDYIKSMALSAQDSAYLWQMVTDGKNGKKNPFSPTWGAEFYYEMHKND